MREGNAREPSMGDEHSVLLRVFRDWRLVFEESTIMWYLDQPWTSNTLEAMLNFHVKVRIMSQQRTVSAINCRHGVVLVWVGSSSDQKRGQSLHRSSCGTKDAKS